MCVENQNDRVPATHLSDRDTEYSRAKLSKGGIVMIPGDFFVYLLLIPVIFQILLPLALFAGWLVLRMPMNMVRGSHVPHRRAEPILSS